MYRQPLLYNDITINSITSQCSNLFRCWHKGLDI